ncbi:IQ domain-containing protein isoform 2 [Schistosoma japonicum]|uniref:IQ domain-containing protein isoform 2 n=2 Tax=Schistosoma japonicum TaxID=6182 RepID=C1LFP8_SCHJA|nr:IQ domain-containing protein E [Schistosoma japonicum]TNN19042.1 IQ domain-containing protein isoform 2 [Schistosoma japonicum]CAX73526.1 viral A-type inclusion protein repeat [Schistosoma japonicum]
MLVSPNQSSKLTKNPGNIKQNSLRNIRLLHQKVFKLETQLQEKDAQYNRLVTDIKFTRVEELRIQLETAFTEIKRLKEHIQILSEQCRDKKEKPPAKSKRGFTSENNEINFQIKTLGKVIKDLDQQKQELIAKNHCLVNKIQKLYRHLSSNDIKEDISPYRASENGAYNVQNKRSETSADDHLVATIVESTISHKVTNATPKVSMIVRQDENIAKELASAKAQISNLQYMNKQLTDSTEKMKKEYELLEKKITEQESEVQKNQRKNMQEHGCQTDIQMRKQYTDIAKPESDEVNVKNKTEENRFTEKEINVIPTKEIDHKDLDNNFHRTSEENKSEMNARSQQNRFTDLNNLGDSPPIKQQTDNTVTTFRLQKKAKVNDDVIGFYDVT